LKIETLNQLVRTAFTEALKIQVDDETAFFDAGGDSLAAETVLTSLSKDLGFELPGWLLLDYQTVPELSAAILEMTKTTG
jgi:acyl carrier protein